jgi:hypothetical protein
MAAEWIPCGSGFIEADVIRWNEAIWHKRKRGRATKIGERQITGEVIGDTEDWVQLLVRECRALPPATVETTSPLTIGADIRRKRTTIEQGQPHRLLWSDEAARALLTAERPS